MRTNPTPLQRRIGSRVMRVLVSPKTARAVHRVAEWRRRLGGARHRIDYFHQVDDPYSHLATQCLALLAEAYAIEIVPHLVGRAEQRDLPEPELLDGWALRDAAGIAPAYGLTFSASAVAPAEKQVELANRILAATGSEAFATRAVAVGEALWSGDGSALEDLAKGHDVAGAGVARARVEEGNARRKRLGHYSGAMFYYGREWYWGVDRLHHLERCLEGFGARRAGAVAVAPRPAVDPGSARDDGSITLDFFPSLRSPYTAIVYDRTLELVERTGVALALHPVMPMVMRGVPASFAKGRYIASDAGREAECDGVPFGRLIDPIGRPVERCFSLFPWAREQGRAAELLGSFLRGAWAEGVDTSSEEGLRGVVEAAGLSWVDALAVIDNDDWREELEQNRLTMYRELGLWGVPSYRVRGPAGRPDFSCWGQDRLWHVAQVLRERIAAR
jgi:2-hydroxychromene-2-carboxylate isomerase